jgi:DNA repair protein RAD50
MTFLRLQSPFFSGNIQAQLIFFRYTKALDSIKALRKDRVAELKTEKERLDGLSREKTHADKLKARIADLNQTIAAKEVEHDETKKAYDALVVSNQKFYEYATHFREVYIRVENAQESMLRVQGDLDEARVNLQEMPGTFMLKPDTAS